MEKILIFIKHNLQFIWLIIESLNGMVFHLLYGSRLEEELRKVFNEVQNGQYEPRRLELSDAESLHELIRNQDEVDMKYFSPHGFDLESIRKQFKNRSFLLMGIFYKHKLAGYFFLRFFVNKKCFVGRLIDKEYRGKGIGELMNKIMYETAWGMKFRCLSTISMNNAAVMRAHSRNQQMIFLKRLQDDYLLVEFLSNNTKEEQ